MNLEQAESALQGLAPKVSAGGTVRLECSGPVAHVRIDHPQARGAFTLAMMAEFARHVRDLEAWDGAAIVLGSTDPKGFCSGGHVPELVTALDDTKRAQTMSTAMTTVLRAWSALPAVSVCALDGLALGGGAELSMACDFRVGGPAARIHFVQTRLGIGVGWGAAGRLAELFGRRAAMRILLWPRPISVGEGLQLGLFDRRCDAGAEEAAIRWLLPVCEAGPQVIRALKRQVLGDDEQQCQAFAQLWLGDVHRAKLKALGFDGL